ncbi:MAG: gamma-glutamyltransferase [Gemmatimonadaceae bacterium]
MTASLPVRGDITNALRNRPTRASLLAVLTLLVSLPLPSQTVRDARSRNGVVVSSHYLASDIGAQILAKGGNAVDAAVATAFGLAVTHPSAGNIGGGGFMIIRLADGRATTIDYREKAPLKSTATMYVAADGSLNYAGTDSGWKSPGVPGTVRGLSLAHQKYGKLPWKDVVQPAADLAASGFVLSKELAAELNYAVSEFMTPFPSSVAAYGKPGGGKWAAGDRLKLPQLARALGAIADRGPEAFYSGWIADSLDAQMRAHGGLITKADLAAYRAVERQPARGTFLGNEIISMGPPSSGGMVMIMTLNMLEAMAAQRFAPNSPEFLHRRIEAARRVYLERARWMGDSDFVKVPMDRLLSKTYAAELARSIDQKHASKSDSLGADLLGQATAMEPDETTHFSVVDADGNAVSNTYTLEGGYGSGVVVAGFILNNEMGDFNKKPGNTTRRGDIGTPPNIIQPGKRMLSSMSPAIVTRNGQLRLVTGSPGGRTIPNTVLNVILGVTAFGKNVRQAVDASRLHNQWLPDTTSIEAGGASAETIAKLRAMGHHVGLGRDKNQGDAHSITYDPATHIATGANDTRSPDSKASAAEPARKKGGPASR